MEIKTSTKNILDKPDECLVIEIKGSFNGKNDFGELRKAIDDAKDSIFNTVYLDIRQAKDIELSSCNEIIHIHYELNTSGKELILFYQKGHEAEKWIDTAGLDKFIKLAVVHE